MCPGSRWVPSHTPSSQCERTLFSRHLSPVLRIVKPLSIVLPDKEADQPSSWAATALPTHLSSARLRGVYAISRAFSLFPMTTRSKPLKRLEPPERVPLLERLERWNKCFTV